MSDNERAICTWKIIHMAMHTGESPVNFIESQFDAVREDERNACIAECEALAKRAYVDYIDDGRRAAELCADAIRARVGRQ